MPTCLHICKPEEAVEPAFLQPAIFRSAVCVHRWSLFGECSLSDFNIHTYASNIVIHVHNYVSRYLHIYIYIYVCVSTSL